MARAIAGALPKPHKSEQGYIQTANGTTVTWCIGHLLELATPDEYDPKYKQWRYDDLPIAPVKWQLTPKPSAKKQLSTVVRLIKKATTLVHAGDPDREGQLLVDEVINHANPSPQLKHNAQRLLISDLNTAAIKRALENLIPNTEMMPLSVSALARSRADWLYGMNLTRAVTLSVKKHCSSLLSIGRVQTPLLGLIAQRDEAIAAFVPHDFYDVEAQLQFADEQINAKWQPSEACKPYQDSEGRVIDIRLAENVVKRVKGQAAELTNLKQTSHKQSPPLPYNLSSLQVDANKRFGLSAQQVLDTCQKLYETHKAITYPRSDNRYLPKAHFKEAAGLFSAISNNANDLTNAVENATIGSAPKCFNDAKVAAHHAIIPTAKKLGAHVLGDVEKKVYDLIARQYLAQFYPDHQYQKQKLSFNVAGGHFIANRKATVEPGFTVLFKDTSKTTRLSGLAEGATGICQDAHVLAKQTQPPEPFTEASLLKAMTGIAKFVEDTSLKTILKDTDGLGTEATRASMIELLIKRGYVQRKGKVLNATELGLTLIKRLPKHMSLPDKTALWEQQLALMSERKASYKDFMAALNDELTQTLLELKKTDFSLFAGISAPKRSQKRRFKSKPKRKKSA